MTLVSQLSNPRSYAVIGTGALGGFYGAKLQKSGLDVHFLLRSDYDWVSQHGLQIESVWGDFQLPQVPVYNNPQKMPPCDVVIVAIKSTENHLLPQILPPVLKPDGVVLVLQNGLGIEPEIAEIVGNHRVLGGICVICSNKIKPGYIRHLDYGMMKLAEYNHNYQSGGITPRLQQIGEDFKKAGVPLDIAEDLLSIRWEKLVWNIPYNGLSVVLNARTDQMMSNPATRVLVEEIMGEVLEGAKGCDRFLEREIINQMLSHTETMTPYKTSMKIDYDQRRPLEIDAILGNPLKMATAGGVHLPRIQMLYQQLKFLDTQNCP
ncbi:putative 2-dehydropantoate 2-reductase [Limnospira fusiformis]|uniref:putative 2-dehydropantoate 2-reductase n=1 Tax=Limnospira fusiformis TaxID=54297 RepID=UPI001448D6A9|nr:putative 2-dehydropantoate 2-reductase [Limnospira fusiformis SAG 85.79]